MAAGLSGMPAVIGLNLSAPLGINTGQLTIAINQSKWLLCREYDLIFDELANSESDDIRQIAGCRKPCKYRTYRFLGEPLPSPFPSEHFIFSLWAVSNKTKVKTEELIYPSSSLVAEFGGNLSLFLGFSFIALWDKISVLVRFLSTRNWADMLNFLWINITTLCWWVLDAVAPEVPTPGYLGNSAWFYPKKLASWIWPVRMI